MKEDASSGSDFLISYHNADRERAEWIASTLADAGYTTLRRAWAFRDGQNFALALRSAAADTECTIAVLSPRYMAGLFTQAGWTVVLGGHPGTRKGALLRVRVARCQLPYSFAPISYYDLVDLDARRARAVLLGAVADAKVQPASKRALARPSARKATAPPSGGSADQVREAARTLAELLETAYTTFVAQCRVRDRLVARIRKRLRITESLQFEAFFHKYFGRMDPEELRMHAIIRGYTRDALRKYNQRAYRIVRDHSELAAHLPSLQKLRNHLSLWLAKYRSVFLEDESMCLLYVGVEEKVPFPRAIDAELRAYLSGKPLPKPAPPQRVKGRTKRSTKVVRRGGEDMW